MVAASNSTIYEEFSVEEWLPLPRIARLCELPESSARRYAVALSEFIPHRRAGRLVLYKVEIASQILTKTAELFGKGMRLAQVKEEIAIEIPEAQGLVMSEEDHDRSVSPKKIDLMATEFMRSVNAIREDMGLMGAALERVQGVLGEERHKRENLAVENAELRQKIGILEKELVRLRKDRRDLELYLVDKIKGMSDK